MKYDDLERLNSLREKGAITEEEYQREKEKILNQTEPSSPSPFASGNLLGMDVNSYCMLIHLSLLCGFVIPVIGYAVPIILWIMNKDHNERVNVHGKIVINWMISAIIYAAISGVLIVIFIGIPLLAAVGIATVIFSILGGIKANQGIAWKYPLTIDFIK